MAALTANDPAFQPDGEHADTSVAGAVCLYGYYGDRAADQGHGVLPAAYVGHDAPPFLVAHGDHDTQIAIGHADRFVARLRTGSLSPVVYLRLPGAQHLSTCSDPCASTRSSTGSRRLPHGCASTTRPPQHVPRPAATASPLGPTTDALSRVAQLVKRGPRGVTDGQVDIRGDGGGA